MAVGIKPGDEALTTPLSFIATANAVLHADGIPRFADIDKTAYTMDPGAIEGAIGPRTRAIIPVHLYGYPADMDQILETARRHNLKVIEDACQAHGATYRGRKVGSLGDAGCFSFYPSKNMTVYGDGGMVVTNDKGIASAVAKLRDCGRVSQYEHDVVGYTARLNNVNAAIGRVQLRRLDEWNERRRVCAGLYDKVLSGVEGLALPPRGGPDVVPVYHLYVVRSRRRDQLRAWLDQSGVGCGVHYGLPIHLQPIYRKMFGYAEGAYPVAEAVSHEVLSLPMYPELTDDYIRFVGERIREFSGR
jgi:dTDP-4-amino-4,6-dideoxygalactose transaminase